MSKSPNPNEYDMNHKYRGFAVIFNHYKYIDKKKKKRKGTQYDVEALQKTLPGLGFESGHIIVEDDLTKDAIFDYWNVERRAKYAEILKNSDCIAIFILTHGSTDNGIHANDADYNLYSLVEKYASSNFIELAGKPKLFFINACRGDEDDPGIHVKHIASSEPKAQAGYQTLSQRQNPIELHFINTGSTSSVDTRNNDHSHSYYADFLISLSSHHNHVSYRNLNGTWYIQELCNSIKKKLDEVDIPDIIDILVYTNQLVSQRQVRQNKRKQIPNYNSTLCRKLYFKAKK